MIEGGDDPRPHDDAATLRHDVISKLYVELAKFPTVATRNDHYLALSYVVRDRLLHRWVSSARTYLDGKHRAVIYLSMEYLIGPQLGSNLMALGLSDAARSALAGSGVSLDELIEHEEEPGLGNGGLGRLAACYMDSLATLDLPAIGHGLRYEFGIFDQHIRDGWQVEATDRWLRNGNPWEVRRYEIEHPVGFGGHVEHSPHGVRWVPERVVKGIPYDVPVAGYGTATTNFLRLWSAVADEEFDLDAFQVGEYWRAVDAKIRSETLTKVLYPNDSSPAGKQLRLEQQYFFVSCALQDCIRLLTAHASIRQFADLYAIQLNDTHPALAVAELMRLFVDIHGFGWDEAWDQVRRSMAYTNHTLLPEALETWPLPLLRRLLPRHLEIIFEINRRFLDEVRARFPGDEPRLRRMSLIGEEGEKSIRMAHLATVASHHINGVAELHSRLLRETVLRDFAELWPERFTNVTNGVTPRRFVALSNPGLADLVTEAIGDGWIRDLDRLRDLEPYADDAAFQDRWRSVKHANKQALAGWLREAHGITCDPSSMFDAHCKRIHEYKRQHLNLLHVITLWDRIRRGSDDGITRTVILAGKAAPAYRAAKLIIRLAHGIGEAIAADPRTHDRLRVVFVPDFSVKTAQRIYPAADLSEQISTAGMEASGTGNMKFTLNGALTIGTLDGANVEIREAVGAEHFFLFGLTADQVTETKRVGYRPGEIFAKDPELARAIELIADGTFSRGDRTMFRPIIDDLVYRDPFLVLADFRAYAEAQQRVEQAWRSPTSWLRSSILNCARAGKFSSDRSIRDYAERIWRIAPVSVQA
ncbi:MAG: glycogen/starch/alpha-glucan phosphorylase [Deltaproteobacteria bacterium]|nr:glycogen/starch/alpha-glucan phosphorylase [Deltaproteobacteria bacterium]MDQ3298114.1 glycogen/starch/alpha-glucan phosphorylase [Myxococcota bacterium]